MKSAVSDEPLPPVEAGAHPSTSIGGLAAIFGDYRIALLRFLAARTGDPQLAEDLLQDLWIKLAANTTGPVTNPRAYLFRMANNLALDHARGTRRAMARDRGWLDADGASAMMPEERPDPAPLADALAERRQESEILARAIADLPAGARRALLLYRFDEMSPGEVAGAMGLSRSGVEKHLAVAMKHLRQALVNCGFTGATASDARTPGETASPAEPLT